MNAYRRLADGLPGRSAGKAEGIPTDARAARDWVSGLPLADRAQTSRLLLEAIDKLNANTLDASQRLAVLEVLRPAVADALAYIEHQILGSSFPLPSSKSALGHRAHAFHESLALAYRLALVDICAPRGKVPFLRGKRVVLALQRALFHQGAALTANYLLYLKPSPGMWAPLHDLGRFAFDVKLADKLVAEPLLAQEVSASQLYRQALLLAISNPYRLSQREQLDLAGAALGLVGFCPISNSPTVGAFLVPEGEDAGPGYLPSERPEAVANGRSFDVSRLREKIQAQLTEGSREVVLRAVGARQVRLAADLARRCVSAWSASAERNHQRLSAGHQLDTIIGLSAMHYFLAGERDFESFMRQAHGAGAALSAGEAATWAGSSSEQSRPGVFRAHVLDQSLGGYQLAWDKSHAVRARVGELVGLAVPSEGADDRDWMLAIIRWLRYDPDGALDAGLELLARRARAVGLRPSRSDDGKRAALRGVEFSPVRADGDGALHLLVPSILDRRVELIELTRGADPMDFESAPSISWLGEIRTVEHTGDYLHLAGALGDNGEPASNPPPN